MIDALDFDGLDQERAKSRCQGNWGIFALAWRLFRVECDFIVSENSSFDDGVETGCTVCEDSSFDDGVENGCIVLKGTSFFVCVEYDFILTDEFPGTWGEDDTWCGSCVC